VSALKKVLNEFKEFISKGNVIDLAIGVIIGGAFGKIITSLVNDIVMPVIGIILGGVNFSKWVIVLGQKLDKDNNLQIVSMNIGAFINTVVDFLLIALVIFLTVKVINRFRRKKEKEVKEELPPEPSEEVKLLTEIRDLLKK